MIGFYSTHVTITNNALSYNESGIDVTRTWTPWTSNLTMMVNGSSLTDSDSAYVIGEAIKAANTQEYVSISLNQGDEVELTNSNSQIYYAVFGGYRSPYLATSDLTGTSVKIHFPTSGAHTDVRNAAEAIGLEQQMDHETTWTPVTPTWTGFPTTETLNLQADHTYRFRAKLTHKSYVEASDPIERTLITYSSPVSVITFAAPTLSNVGSSVVTQTTATVSATSDEDATMYYVVTTSSTAPSAAEVMAGQDHTGTAAYKSGSGAATASVAKDFSVTGLTAGTPYYVYVVATDSGNNVSTVGSASFTTQDVPVMSGTVTIDGTAKFGETLTVNLSGLTYTPATNDDQPTYQWKRDGVAISGATNASYTLAQADIGAVITMTVTADGNHATGSMTSTATAAVAKADGPSAPGATTLDGKGTTSITLTTVTGQEYSKDNGATWQDSSTFTGLTPDTDYTFVTRVKETATHAASAASTGATFRTEAVIVPVIGGTVTIDGTAKYGETLIANLSGLTYTPATNDDQPTYQWKRDGVVIPGATNASYTLAQADIGAVITVTVAADGNHATGSVTSTAAAAVAKADGPLAPGATTLDSKTTTSITLTAVAGQEYSKDNGVTWQDSATFMGLTPDTDYMFVTRVKETATHVASAASTGATFRTEAVIVPVIGGTVTIDGTAKYGETLTANLSGLTYTPATNDDQPTYQWKRDGVAIPGATNGTYTLVQADIGAVITVTVAADGNHVTGSVTSTATAAVAKADGASAPGATTLDSKATTSITLTAVAGQEYSKDNGATWQDSATFTGLTPDTDYMFVTRVKETATHAASAVSTGATFRTEAVIVPVIGGTVTIDGTAKYGETLTANLSGLTYTPATNDDHPTYQWKRDGVAIPGATNASYTLVQADIGAVITVTVAADGNHATGSVTSTATAAVAKADGAAAPSAVTLVSKTTTSITLTAVAGQEYSKDNGVTWQDSATFTGLTPDTDYTFVTRVKETATHEASAASSGATFRTEAVSAPVIGGTVAIDGVAKYGETLTANLSGLTYTPATNDDHPTYQWKRDGVAIPGATNASYTLVQADIGAVITVTVAADGNHATGSVTSTATAAVAKADGAVAPSAATLDSKTTTSITLTAVAGQEYSKDNGATWQDSATFTGLTPDTDYTFVTRVKETATHAASAVSTGTTFRTEAVTVPVIGGTVTIDGTAKYGETLTANLSGLTYTPTPTSNDHPTYQWKRDGVVIPGATNGAYTLVQADIGAVITVTVTSDGNHATGSLTSTATTAVAKADGASAPGAATLDSKTTTSITLNAVTGQEYSKDNGATWQDSATFTGLTPDTDYTFVTRVKETATHAASTASTGATLRTAVEWTYSILPIQNQNAAALDQGYANGSQETLTISVTNSGAGTLMNLSVSLSGTQGQAFDITQPLATTLNSGAPATTFTVKAKGGLEAGTYTATVTITADNMTHVSFTVTQAVNLPNAPANPQGLTAAAGDRAIDLSWNTVTGATYYNVYMSQASNQYTSIPVATVTDATYNVQNLINGQHYYFVVRAGNLGGLGGESNEVNAIPATVPEAPTHVAATAGNGSATITFTAPPSDGGNIITAYEVFDAQNNLLGTGNSSPITIAGLTNGTSYTFTVKAKNAVGWSGSSAPSNAVTPSAPSSDDDNSSTSSEPTTPSTPASTGTGVDVLVNGKIEKAGTATTAEVNGQQVTTIVVDEVKLQQRLDAEGIGAIITIPVSTKSDVMVGELNGRMVKNMENQQAVVEIRTDKATYTLPAKQINIDAISGRFGTNLALQDIKVKIEIAATQGTMVSVVEDAANKGGFSLVVPPLNFKVNAVYGERTEEVSRFNAYVKRSVSIPDHVDPNRITTGVVVEPDGTVRHVPTNILRIDGKYYAEINSLTNSTYSVVWHPLQFEDVANHWAKDAVNNMGSRMVVNGTGDKLFSPDLDITRAEFAAIMVRGLGLRLENGESSFTDVKQAAWYSSAVQTAYEYGLIAGYEDGTFRPNDKITREQAMLIVSKAMKITGLKGMNADQGANLALAAFSDVDHVSNWSLNGVADSVRAGIITGRSNDQLAPKAFITRAEVAMMMQSLLQKSELINK